MEELKDLILNSIETTFKNVIEKDKEYIKLNEKKKELLIKLQKTLEQEEFLMVKELLECEEEQRYITAMGFSFVRVLDLERKQ